MRWPLLASTFLLAGCFTSARVGAIATFGREGTSVGSTSSVAIGLGDEEHHLALPVVTGWAGAPLQGGVTGGVAAGVEFGMRLVEVDSGGLSARAGLLGGAAFLPSGPVGTTFVRLGPGWLFKLSSDWALTVWLEGLVGLQLAGTVNPSGGVSLAIDLAHFTLGDLGQP